MQIEVVYALPERQTLLMLDVPEGSTAAEAIARSGLLDRHPELTRDTLRLGIFSRSICADTVLQTGDRVEIYRSLLADPKQSRRWRADATSRTRK